LEPGSWIAIYMPLIVIFVMIIPQQRELQRRIIHRIHKRKGIQPMTNELLQKHIGKRCKISTGSYGTTITGKLLEVKENWVEVETRKGNELINAEYIQNIKILIG
jgi:hypothetical protein